MKAAFFARLARIGRFWVMLGCTLLTALLLLLGSVRRFDGVRQGSCRPVDILAGYGYAPEDITDVIITHAHHDHIAAVGYYKRAVIHIQEDEYVAGKKYIPDELTVNTFEEVFRIDDNIVIRKIGGHSKGSCIVEFEHDSRHYVIAGDECYARECLTGKIPTGSSYNLKNSEAFVNTYGGDDYRVLLCHENGMESGYIIS